VVSRAGTARAWRWRRVWSWAGTCGARARAVQALGVSTRRGQALAREQVWRRAGTSWCGGGSGGVEVWTPERGRYAGTARACARRRTGADGADASGPRRWSAGRARARQSRAGTDFGGARTNGLRKQWRACERSCGRGMVACEQKTGGVSRRSTGQERTQFGRAQKQRGKTEASASPAVGRAMQGDNVQGNDVQDDSV
jgi:hypothetical protein